VLSSLPIHDQTALCPLCKTDAPAVGRINRRIRYRCACGLTFDLVGPKEVGESLKLTPHETRGLIQGRQPWHHHGKPVVAMPATKPRIPRNSGSGVASDKSTDDNLNKKSPALLVTAEAAVESSETGTTT
jgi:hypothetical protein